ncbi:YfiR family protein [Candidatus Magnetomonas plexicatena]|uniref:YfiR family protein n=1 Tax=Candidatus Magnetomonas plexicatena TaxID=2552947 RepID=UPI0011053208|nr:YfiR family protein [Nitrospirales bacterium LBB_01]
MILIQRGRTLKYYLYVVVLLSLLLQLLNPYTVFSAPKNEHEMKASCILNFTIFVEWPNKLSVDSKNPPPLTICIFGNSPIIQALNLQKEITSKNVNIININNTDKITDCHILFIGAANAADIPTLLIKLVNKPVLTISDHETFNKDGGIIQFVIKDNMVRFKINNEAAKKAGLTISSQLLELTEDE